MKKKIFNKLSDYKVFFLIFFPGQYFGQVVHYIFSQFTNKLFIIKLPNILTILSILSVSSLPTLNCKSKRKLTSSAILLASSFKVPDFNKPSRAIALLNILIKD
jgi:hypothetical protein